MIWRGFNDNWALDRLGISTQTDKTWFLRAIVGGLFLHRPGLLTVRKFETGTSLIWLSAGERGREIWREKISVNVIAW